MMQAKMTNYNEKKGRAVSKSCTHQQNQELPGIAYQRMLRISR
jgi:hypothetical protein